jgi:hypothetical protein
MALATIVVIVVAIAVAITAIMMIPTHFDLLRNLVCRGVPAGTAGRIAIRRKSFRAGDW